MCTLIVAFYPGTPNPLVIGSNRDENPFRPSKDWELRESGHVLCPLDVRGGTWIGVNQNKMFCAITNWDIEGNDIHGLKSRGALVYEILKSTSITNGINAISFNNKALDFKPFNILIGDDKSLYHISNDRKSFICTQLSPGLYISTGLGFNQQVKRDIYIRKELASLFNIFKKFDQPVYHMSLIPILASHNDGIGSEDSICVHDKDHEWETRSSAVLHLSIGDKIKWKAIYFDGFPCKQVNKISSWSDIDCI